MRILCVYKSGGDFDTRYVIALFNGVQRFVDYPFKFYCLTNVPDQFKDTPEINTIELQHDWRGWWSKIELFRPDINYKGCSIYFDLDVLILKPIEKFIEQCLHSRFPLLLRSTDKIGSKNNWPSSSIMSWHSKQMNRVYFEFMKDPIYKIKEVEATETSRAGSRTDQGFIRKLVNPETKFQDVLPEGYIVFKNEFLKDPVLFDHCNILNWTGRPRFASMGYDFWEIQSIWDLRTNKDLYEVHKENK